MNYLTTERSLDSQATWAIAVLDLFFRHGIHGFLYKQALEDVQSTGAGIKYLYCTYTLMDTSTNMHFPPLLSSFPNTALGQQHKQLSFKTCHIVYQHYIWCAQCWHAYSLIYTLPNETSSRDICVYLKRTKSLFACRAMSIGEYL